MATQRKEHGPCRDKRGISPSDPRPTNKRSPSSPAPTPPPSAQKNVSTPSEKRVPNYLKPTISSGPDPSAHGAKQALNTAAAAAAGGGQKPNNISRRRSLDHKAAPPPSSLQKSHASGNPPERNLRSLQKTTSFPKPRRREGCSKAPVDAGKSRPVCAGGADRTTDKKRTTSKKGEKCAASSSRVSSASSLSEMADIPVVEGRHEDQESSVPDVEDEVVNVGSSQELLAEISIVEGKDQNKDLKQGESHLRNWDRFSSSVADLNPVEPLPVLGDQTESQDVVEMEEELPEENVLVEETNSNNPHKGEENQGKDIESINNQPDESSSGKPEVEEEKDDEGTDRGTENPREKPTLGEKEEEEEKKEDHVDEENLAAAEAPSSMEREAEDSGTKAKPVEAENGSVAVAAPARQGGGQGKKDSQAYNDVIEETASKLLEKRKNKVKALVGAFETVISLQEPEA